MTTEVATPLVMWPAAQIAARDGVTREAVLKLVREFVERHSLAVTRDTRGRVATINVAAYDHLRKRYGDPSKRQAPTRLDGSAEDASLSSLPAGSRTADGYDEALRQKTWIDAETRRLALNELRGHLVRRDRVEEALRLCVDPIARAFDRLPQEADELAEVYERGGLHGLRQALKELARKGRTAAAEALEGALRSAPATDEPLPFTEGPLL